MASPLTDSLVLVTKLNGITVIPASTVLTRLNYFDGKFLRADDLRIEQQYLRRLVELSNQANGPGVAHGFDVALGAGDVLKVGPGLAIDPSGRVLLLSQEFVMNIQELIENSRNNSLLSGSHGGAKKGSFGDAVAVTEPSPVSIQQGTDLYLITIAHAEALCGEEDVFGKLCEEACVTSTDRPYLVEGVVIRALPLTLGTALATSAGVALDRTHQRSLVASAYFEDERKRIATFISGPGLKSDVWCFGAEPLAGGEVPIGVIARAGNSTVFLDAWTARRERIDTTAKRHWQWRMSMRPWDVFLAQILQFQCQLRDVLLTGPTPGGQDDPCKEARELLVEASQTVSELTRFFAETSTRLANQLTSGVGEELPSIKGGLTSLSAFDRKLQQARDAIVFVPTDRILIQGGIVELPSAGYLPVAPGAVVSINKQVRLLLGEGVDLTFCVVRPDYVAHALEEAQHMERIPLLQGLDNPENKPQVEILVPNGEIVTQQSLSPGSGFEAIVDLNPALFRPPPLTTSTSTFEFPFESPGTNVRIPSPSVSFNGVARSEALPSGGGAAYISAEHIVSRANGGSGGGIGTATQPAGSINTGETNPADISVRANQAAGINSQRAGFWLSLQCERNVFELKRGDTTNFNALAVVGATTARAALLDVELNGVFKITQETARNGSTQSLKGRIEKARLSFFGVAFDNTGDNPRRDRTILIDLGASITLTGGSAIEIVLTHQQNQFQLSANWDKQPLEFKADIVTVPTRAQGPARKTILAEAALKENPDVLSDKNRSHILALDALEVVAATLDDADFADAKARLLFPPPPKSADELIVSGVMDWVLFHRARTKQCGVEVKAPPVAPPRLYQVYHLGVSNDEQLNLVREALQTNGVATLAALDFAPVDVVEFAGGVAALLSDADDVKTDWQAVRPGNFLAYDAIASSRSAADEGAALALSRLGRVEAAVSSVSHTDTGTISELLPVVPTPLAVSGTDGVIVLITETIVQSVCHTVARVNPDRIDQVIELAKAGDFATILGQQLAVKLGSVSFKKDTDDVLAASLNPIVDQWNKLGGGTPGQAVVFSEQGASSEVVGVSTKQAQTIQEALGGEVKPTTLFSARPIPDCPVITFIEFTRGTVPIPCETGPNPLRLTNLSPGGQVTIKNNSSTPFTVLGLSTTGPFSLRQVRPGDIEIKPGESFVVDIAYRFSDPNPSGDRGTLVITTDAPLVTCPSVELEGRIINLPPIDPNPVQRTVAEPEAAAEKGGKKPRVVKKKPRK